MLSFSKRHVWLDGLRNVLSGQPSSLTSCTVLSVCVALSMPQVELVKWWLMDDGLHSVIQQSVRKNIELDAFSWSSACWGCQYVRALSSKCSCHGLLGENVGSLPPGCDVKWQDNSALWVSTGQWSVSSGKKCWLSNHSPCYCGWAPYKPKYVGTVPSTFQLLTTFPQSLKGFSESVQVLAFWFHPFPSLPHKSRNLLSLRTAWSNMLWNIPWFMDQGIEDKEKLLFFFQCFFFQMFIFSLWWFRLW